MKNLREESTKLLDAKYDPLIQRAIADGYTTVQEIARKLGVEKTGLWRMMKRMGYRRPSAGWQKEKRS